MLAKWENIEKNYDPVKADAAHKEAMVKWQEAAAAAKKDGKQPPRAPSHPGSLLTGNARPGNIYNGVLLPTIGYGIRGAIWYQGESNAGRAYQYRDLFPLMIKSWRDEWKQGDFSFYWVQLADFLAEQPQPGESAWAELREAQTMSLSLPNSGQAVIVDVGEGRDIHPRNKLEVGLRLARWALAKDYGIQVPHQSPTYQSMAVSGDKAVVKFDHVGASGLYAFDVQEVRGFAIAGEDKKWHWATGKITGKDTVEVSSPDVKNPVAVRYAWADNPVCNLFSRDGLPATPFRSDEWPGVTVNSKQ
ncbi:MAG: sialate O-acetylesterase [Pirellulales bacterium]